MALAPLLLTDPVRSDELWRRYQIGKADAFRLWKSGKVAGQMYRRMLVLSRADVEGLTQKKAPVIGRG
jgi:hypothetical protein